MKIAIVGAGIAGLAAAHDLIKQGHQITIFEAADYVGGLAAGFKESHWDWSVERFYHHWFQSDSAILGLIDELGWSNQLVFPRPVTVMYHKDKFYPFDSIPSALMYPGLGWGFNKVRFGLVNLAIRFTNNWQALEKFTVDEWMRKYAGDTAYEAVWERRVIGQFGERYAR
jgi:protoporphyrinogen oxidase